MGALHLSGVYLGSSCIADLNENEFLVNLNTRLLSAVGSSWDDVFMLPDCWWHGSAAGEHRNQLSAVLRREFRDDVLWGLKDPRMCITLPLWLETFVQLGIEPHFILSLIHI